MTRARARPKGTRSARCSTTAALINAMLDVEAIRTAQEKFGKKPLTGEQVRWGLENLDLTADRIKAARARGRAEARSRSPAPTTRARARPASSNGTARSGTSSPTGTRPIDEVVAPMVKEAAAKYAKEKKISAGCR